MPNTVRPTNSVYDRSASPNTNKRRAAGRVAGAAAAGGAGTAGEVHFLAELERAGIVEHGHDVSGIDRAVVDFFVDIAHVFGRQGVASRPFQRRADQLEKYFKSGSGKVFAKKRLL